MAGISRKRRMLLTSLLALVGVGAAGAVAPRAVFSMSVFGKKAQGERLARMQASPNWKNGHFQNLEPFIDPIEKKNRLTGMLGFMFEDDKGQKPEKPVPTVKTPLAAAAENSLIWLGHSGFFIRAAGLSILADPSLHNSFPFEFGGFFKPFKGSDIYQPEDIPAVDVLLITHDHYDHLDMRTVCAIEGRTKRVICPLGVGAHLESWGWPASKITELDWYETSDEGRARFTLTPCQHFSGRTTERNTTLWGGFVMNLDGFMLYLSGDGGYGSHFKEIAKRFPRIDLAILELGQYNDDWAGVHLRPQDWRRALADLKPATVMPCHNTKFDLSRHLWTDPLNAARENAGALNLPLCQPMIGEPVPFAEKDKDRGLWWTKAA